MPDNSLALAAFLEALPQDIRPALVAAALGGDTDPAKLQRTLAKIDWTAHRHALEGLLIAVLPVEDLVPDIYHNWRPVVRDGFAFIGARLSPERLLPKLIEQLSLPPQTPTAERVLIFIRRIPSLQKLGQTIARNANLDAGFRVLLSALEDGIHEVDEPEILTEIDTQLGTLLSAKGIKVEPSIFAEGSVSALVRFKRLRTATAPPARGVFKVLKPFIADYFQEDLTLLAELADYFDANQGTYNLDSLNLRAILDDVRWLFERETDFISERASLTFAAQRYSGISGVRVPRPIPSLSTGTITAMTEEPSVKVTEAFASDPIRRTALARKLIECLVAQPLFSAEASSPFHADPHAGNLRVNETTGDLVLLDWALTESLTLEDRRSLMLLYVTLPLRDEGQIVDALCQISAFESRADRARLKREVEAFMDVLPFATLPGPDGVSNLMDRLLRSGARFSGAFLIFRKMLSTLGDVVRQLSPGITIDGVVAEYALARALRKAPSPPAANAPFTLPLKPPDILKLGLSAQSFLPRVWAQTLRSVARNLATRCPLPDRSPAIPHAAAAEEDSA